MCLIVFAIDRHPRYRLILAANRDEYYSRPTDAACYWPDAPRILAGRDLHSGGTWLGITRGGRLAAITNYREPQAQITHRLSRGLLVADYLKENMETEEYLKSIGIAADSCGGFNLLLGDSGRLFHFSNRSPGITAIAAGIHGLSNHLLDTPWPKVVSARERLEVLLQKDEPQAEELLDLLRDRTPFPDRLLPDTGVGLERERLLSSLFIAGDDYGTRSTTVIMIDRKNRVNFLEQSYDSSHEVVETVSFEFTIGA